MNGPSYFEIQANNVARAVHFYQELLGWNFTRDETITAVEYWRIETGGSRGALLQRPAPLPAGPHGTTAYVCSMEVTNFDEAAQKVASLGGMVAMDKFAIPGVCWQGYFLDTEGNTFGLFQPDPNAK